MRSHAYFMYIITHDFSLFFCRFFLTSSFIHKQCPSLGPYSKPQLHKGSIVISPYVQPRRDLRKKKKGFWGKQKSEQWWDYDYSYYGISSLFLTHKEEKSYS
ncbi:hypothetical protein Ddye_028753 [Dipteronia dyeriana]|uniref:Uncharacterized protein n=1 Tax=Dipteronia dyeriana TaxID=168575 RepID=A0AAD9WJZ0_9ROSI|nr:hypothetical protein Ddye_028753 [Dipteronia dyeriana]